MSLKIKRTGRQGRSRKQLLGEFKEARSYWNLKEEALHGTLRKEGTDLSSEYMMMTMMMMTT
jgi:hypothetical protein